jgi:hypothetical protein
MTILNNLISGSSDNQGIKEIEKVLFRDGFGKIVISPFESDKVPGIIITENGAVITGSNLVGSLAVKDDAVNIQGTTMFTSKGENIKKGEYSENPKNTRKFTYKETVLLESIPQELASQAAGKMGINMGMDGIMPIMTDISAGPLPHMHTISMKHVHRIEPPYLYRIPPSVNFIKGALNQLKQFFSLGV